jgi:phage-related protein
VKPVIWLGSSLSIMRDLEDAAKQAFGHALARVQAGLEPVDWKPISTIGPGVAELRVRVGGSFRLVYVARFEEAVYVLHVFQKKSQKTSMLDIELARSRYRSLIRSLRES